MTMRTKSDEELISLMQKGDPDAYTEIYTRYHAAVYVHVYNKLRSREEAKDLVHDLFIDIWKRRTEFDLQTSLKAYLFTAARYRVFKFISRRQNQDNYISSLSFFAEVGECITDHRLREKEMIQLIDKEISALPPKMKEIFNLSRKDGLTHREIAEKLDISETTVKKQVNNSLKILRNRFKFCILFSLFL